MRDLIRLRRLLRHGRLKDPAKVLLHLGRLKERYQQAWRYVKINLEDLRLSWRWNRDELRLAASRDGAYLLRTNLEESDPAKLWSQYIQLTEVEAVIRALKSDLAIRPIWHFTPKRVEAHVMVAFLGYCLWVCLKHKLRASAPSLTPMAAARSICPHSNGRSLVQASRRRLHLPGTHHSARSYSSRPHPSTQLALTATAPAQNLQDRSQKCVDNLRPLKRGLQRENLPNSKKM